MVFPSYWTAAEIASAKSRLANIATNIVPYVRACTIISIIMSSIIITSGLKWYKELVKSKIYMKMIMMISFCDIMGCLAMSYGYPVNDSICSMQGMFNYTFFRASWFWTTAATTTIFTQINYGKIPYYMKFRFWNAYIWILSLILLIIPIQRGEKFGGCNNGTNYGRLVLAGHEDLFIVLELFWPILCIFVCVVLPIYLLKVTLPSIYQNGSQVIYRKLKKLIWHIVLYPIALLVFWGPNVTWAMFYVSGFYNNGHTTVDDYVNMTLLRLSTGVWCYFFGCATTIIFLTKSSEVRRKWYALFKRNILSRFCPGSGSVSGSVADNNATTCTSDIDNIRESHAYTPNEGGQRHEGTHDQQQQNLNQYEDEDEEDFFDDDTYDRDASIIFMHGHGHGQEDYEHDHEDSHEQKMEIELPNVAKVFQNNQHTINPIAG